MASVQKVSPFLWFDNNAEEAVNYYKTAIGAEITAMMRFKDAPPMPAEQTGGEGCGPGNPSPDKIMHASFKVGDTVIMASDAPQGYKEPAGISVALGLNDTAKGEQIFNALSDGGQVTMPYQATFWAAGFGMCVDRFGIPWMINVEEAGAHSGGSES